MLLLACLAACVGGTSPPPPTPSDTATADTSVGATAASGDTSVSPTGATGRTSATGATGRTGDTGGCGPDCYLDDGLCVYPNRGSGQGPMPDDRIDQLVGLTCGPTAFVVCDTGHLGHAFWADSENPEIHIYDATSREWIASFVEQDDDVGHPTCGYQFFKGDPDQLPCARELLAWIYSPEGYARDCNILDGVDDPTGDTGPRCDNPASCIRDEWPR